jgi:hypothetical protein
MQLTLADPKEEGAKGHTILKSFVLSFSSVDLILNKDTKLTTALILTILQRT